MLGITACFLLLISKENNNYKTFRFIIFIIGFVILIISEMTSSFAGHSNNQLIFSIFLPLIIFLMQYMFLFYKFKGKNN